MMLFKIQQIMTLLNIPTQDITNKTANKPNLKSKRKFQHCHAKILSLVSAKTQFPGQYLNKEKCYIEVGPQLLLLLLFA